MIDIYVNATNSVSWKEKNKVKYITLMNKDNMYIREDNIVESSGKYFTEVEAKKILKGKFIITNLDSIE